MNHTTDHQEGKVPPWWSGMVFSQLELVEQAALSAVVAPSLFLFQMAALDQIVDGAFDGAAREMQFTGDGADGRPALAILVGSIFQVHIHGLGAVRDIFRVDGGKVAQMVTSYSSCWIGRMGGLWGALRCSFGSGAGECSIPPFPAPVGGSGGSSSKSSS